MYTQIGMFVVIVNNTNSIEQCNKKLYQRRKRQKFPERKRRILIPEQQFITHGRPRKTICAAGCEY